MPIPKPRREGQSGGMKHGSSGSASRARGGSPGAPRKGYKSGGGAKPPKKPGCPFAPEVWMLIGGFMLYSSVLAGVGYLFAKLA